jgi:hypothetical protein
LPRRDAEGVLIRARLAGTPESAAELLDDHRVLYPPRHPSTDLEPLYPDRLAEDFLALTTPRPDREGDPASAADWDTDAADDLGGLADSWAADMPAALLAPSAPRGAPPWARTGVTVLIQAAVRWEHLRTAYLYPLLRAHPELAAVAGGVALAALVDLDDLDSEVIDAIEPLLAEAHDFELDLVMATLTVRVAERRLAAATGLAERAKLHARFGNRYSAAGLRERAQAEFQQAADAYRALADGDGEDVRAGLADALHRLANERAAQGHSPEVPLALTQEAAGLLRLPGRDREAYLRRLVPVLLSLGDRLSLLQLGRQEEALAVQQEAVALARQLADLMGSGAGSTVTGRAAEDRLDSQWNLAVGLGGLSSRLRLTGHQADAVLAAQEGVTVARRLAETHRNRYLGLLAWALGRLAEAQRASEVNPAWLAAARESVDLYRLLAKANSNVYLDPLAGALFDYGNALDRNGQLAEAQDATEESIAIRRDLARADPALHGIMYAASLCDYSDMLERTGQDDRATVLAREALALVESLPGMEPRNIAMATMTLGKRLTRPGNAAEGRALSTAAVALYRQPGAEGDTDWLAEALGTLASQELVLGRDAEATAAAEEAVALMRALAAEDPAGQGLRLVWALHGLAQVLDGRPETKDAALAAIREAVDIHRGLLSPDDPRDLTAFAHRQQKLVGMLSSAERFAEALPFTAEVVAAARVAVQADHRPKDQFLLSWALHDFAWARCMTNQELPEAADAFDELVRLLRDMPGDGTMVLPDTALTLRSRALLMTQLGRTAEAAEFRLAAQAEESAAKLRKEAIAPGGFTPRRLLRVLDASASAESAGDEALAITAVTADHGSTERALAREMLRRRRREGRPRAGTTAGEHAPGDGPDAASLLVDIIAFDANDRRESASVRVGKAKKLARLGDPRGRQYLVAQAEDEAFPRRSREEAAKALTKAGDPRGKFLLADIKGPHAAAADAGNPAWALAVTATVAPMLRGASPATSQLVSQWLSAGYSMAAAKPHRTRRRRHAGGGAAVLALLIPAGLSVLIGAAIAQAPGTRPGPGNWMALCVSACLVLLILSTLVSVTSRFALGMSAAGPDSRPVLIGCYTLLMPLLVAAGYLLAAGGGLEFLRPAAEFVWRMLIWR